MLRPVDIERAYAYCKGALTSEQRKNVESRRNEDEEYDALIIDIEELFKSTDAATVAKIVENWKITRVGASYMNANREKETGSSPSAIEELLAEQDNKKRLQKTYLVIAFILLLFIVLILVMR